jgi:hypothetical protein
MVIVITKMDKIVKYVKYYNGRLLIFELDILRILIRQLGKV